MGSPGPPSREVPMEHRVSFKRLVCVCITVVLGGFVATQTALAQAPSRGTIVEMDRESFHQHLKALGFRARGGIGKNKTDSNDEHFRSLPHFSSSFTVGGVTYPYTMLGYPPWSGRPAYIHSVVIPLRMKFDGFGPNHDVAVTFDPKDAVKNILNSPIYQDASFPNGVGQFNDMMQRATFWNKMDAEREWHVKFAPPKVMHTIDIEVGPEIGRLIQSGSAIFGDVLFDFFDSQARTIIQLTGVDPDEVPIFVTQNCTAESRGYHRAFSVQNEDGKETWQTAIYTSWFDEALVGPQFADISALNHELGELFNDPFINNVVPEWRNPPESDPAAGCAFNPLLEVGDPQHNPQTLFDFPAVAVSVDGVIYHLQDLVMLPWFADEVPSSAENGWYDFPATTEITAPAVYCH
jgi:hypothetical protein